MAEVTAEITFEDWVQDQGFTVDAAGNVDDGYGAGDWDEEGFGRRDLN